MKLFLTVLGVNLIFLAFTSPAFAATPAPSEITSFTQDTLQILTLIASAAAIFFLVKGGYQYMTSVGKPQAIDDAKRTIKNALLGLVLVMAAGIVISVFNNALTSDSSGTSTGVVSITPINSVTPSDGLTQVLIDAVTAFMRNIVESATKPIVDGIIGYLTTTPNLLTNSVVLNFWLVSLGIVDSLFVLVVALLGLQLMSAATLGFDDLELKQILPRIGFAFLGANISLFLADYIIILCNALVKAVLNSSGGLHHAWIVDAINPATLVTGTTPLITVVFLILFLIISIVLLLLYISRLILISLSAVLSPFIFLLWTLPKFADFAEIAIKSYFVTVFTVFVHVVIIQLASSFLAVPDHSNNSLVSIAVAIGLFITLLKVPSLLMQMIFYSSSRGTFKKLGNQIMNVMTTDNPSSASRAASTSQAVKLPRKVIRA